MPSIKRLALILLPVVLLGSTYLVFQKLVAAFGLKLGYLTGFLFYWIVWCFLFSWWLLGADRMLQLFRDVPNWLGRPAWLGALFLVVPLALGYGYAFPRAIREADAVIIVLSLVIAIVNGTLEELLWRGAYVSVFPNSRFLATVYPAVGFAVWHFAPQSVVPNTAPGGAVSLVVVAALVGAMWAWVANQTGSILWVTLSHVLFDFSGLGARIYFR
jgi:hypothetical protein